MKLLAGRVFLPASSFDRCKKVGQPVCVGLRANATRHGGDVHMMESTVELLGGLCLSALTLLIGFCIVGSIVAALRAVSRGSGTVSARR